MDKHSTGGVADTTTLILAPLVASVDVPVVKMSGRGLGFSGGTIDKLESIPGFRVDVTEEEALRFAQESGIVLMSQTDNLTPADKKLYALRDVTGTVDSIPLIAASIMSKKIAAGADAIVLDVKCGSGAFMKNAADAERLAGIMADMGRHVGRRVTAVISSMAQPLGMYIGNSLEVMEAIEVLKGNVGGDLLEVSLTLGANMLLLAERVQSEEEGKALLLENIRNGKGLAKFKGAADTAGRRCPRHCGLQPAPSGRGKMGSKSNEIGVSYPYGYSHDWQSLAGNRRRADVQGTDAGFWRRYCHEKTHR